ncbi:hypothetical protein HPP92_018584 [Vanilla planifolia]|uniref:Uncharacterized protein n=1 Tax=Vanilla planifolia TaxID=51239 RepID=A0A835UKX8_VANPL|nr:hypothetical protein HPP92_018584 [Vanilla planifolia]
MRREFGAGAAAAAAATAAGTANKGCGRNIVSWTQEEDDLLREQVSVHGCDNWTVIAAQFKDKTGRQCWRRWFTYLNTESKKGTWSQEEDKLLCHAQKIFGNRWTHIAKMVLGRTDNAVKNRFSTLCKKRAKDETLNKENDEASSKRVLMETSGALKQIRHSEISAGTHGMLQAQPRPTLAVLNQNISTLNSMPRPCHAESSSTPEHCCSISGSHAQGTFLRRDDPKLTALLQQAELLSSLAVKVNAEATNQSLEDAWKELQDYLFHIKGVEIPRKSLSGIDFQLDDFKDLFEDITSYNTGAQPSLRENSHSSSEMSSGSAQLDDEKNHNTYQVELCFLNCDEGLGTSVPGDILSQEFHSPLKAIPPFISFTEEIPSPEFSASERKFLLSVLGQSPTKGHSRSNQMPRTRESHNDSSYPPSCKKVLLDSL